MNLLDMTSPSFAILMSIRPESEYHVTVRGTSVSTSRLHPSKLPIEIVQRWGLPNQHGLIICDDILLHLTFDTNDTTVTVWARKIDALEREAAMTSSAAGGLASLTSSSMHTRDVMPTLWATACALQ